MFIPSRFLKSAQEFVTKTATRLADATATTAHSLERMAIPKKRPEHSDSRAILGDFSDTTINAAKCKDALERQAHTMLHDGMEDENKRQVCLLSIYRNFQALQGFKKAYEEANEGQLCHLFYENKLLELHVEGNPVISVQFDKDYKPTYTFTNANGEKNVIQPQAQTETTKDFATRLTMEASVTLTNDPTKKFDINHDLVASYLTETITNFIREAATAKHIQQREKDRLQEDLKKANSMNPILAILEIHTSELRSTLTNAESADERARQNFIIRAFTGLSNMSNQAIANTLTSTSARENFIKNLSFIRETFGRKFSPEEDSAIKAFTTKHEKFVGNITAQLEALKNNPSSGKQSTPLPEETAGGKALRALTAAKELVNSIEPQYVLGDAPQLTASDKAVDDYQWQLASEKMTERMQEIAKSLQGDDLEAFKNAGSSLREQVTCLQGIMQNQQEPNDALVDELNQMSKTIHAHEQKQYDRRSLQAPQQQATGFAAIEQALKSSHVPDEIIITISHTFTQLEQMTERMQKLEEQNEKLMAHLQEIKGAPKEAEGAQEFAEAIQQAEDAKEADVAQPEVIDEAASAEAPVEEAFVAEEGDLDAVNAEAAEAATEDADYAGPSGP